MKNEKIILLELFQPFAQFRNPLTFYYAQTFPLPPKSTIVGMIQNITGDYYSPSYNKLEIAVYGVGGSIFWNYSRFIKGTPYINKNGILMGAKGDKKINLPLYGSPKTSQRTPTKQQEIYNLILFLYIKGEALLIEKIKRSLTTLSKVISLGRGEDVAFIRNVKEVNFEKKELKDFHIQLGTFINWEVKKELINFESFPAYSIPIKSEFKYKENGQVIQSQSEILLNKNKLKRDVEFKTVFYILDHTLKFKNRQSVEFYSMRIENEEKLKFYFLKESWL